MRLSLRLFCWSRWQTLNFQVPTRAFLDCVDPAIGINPGWNILNRPSNVTVYGLVNGANQTVAETNYSYDALALTSPTGITHHDDNDYGPNSSVARGNLTQVQRLIGGT